MKNSPFHLFLAMGAGILCVISLMSPSMARVPYPVDKAYEDTVRVAVIYTITGSQNVCPTVPEQGITSFNFTMASLQGVANVKTLLSSSATLAQVQALWPGKSPHVVVHINGGWASMSGPNIGQIMSWAVSNYIGWVEEGDDAAYLTAPVFNWAYYSVGFGGNLPSPMFTATWLDKSNDSLWLRAEPNRDTLMDSTLYPHLNGIVRNAILKVNKGNPRLFFKPFGAGANGRCESDPDSFIYVANKITFLGYQQGWNASVEATDGKWNGQGPGLNRVGLVGVTDQFINIAAFQDSIYPGGVLAVRRAVALSYEPQFLKDSVASQQLVYDAIMFASLAWTLRPVDKVDIRVDADTIEAGQSTQAHGDVYYNAQVSSTLSQKVTWTIDPASYKPGDALSDTLGAAINVTATMAWRTVRVIGSYFDPNFNVWVRDTADIYVKPGPPDKVWIESNAVASLNAPRELNLVVLGPSQNLAPDTMYAFLRDKYGNLITTNSGRATTAGWRINPVADASFASVAIVGGLNWQALISRVNNGSGTTHVVVSQGTLKPDTAEVQIRNVSITAIRFVDAVADTVLKAISMTNDDSIRVRIEGLPSNSPTWVAVNATLGLSGGLTANPALPTNAVTTWTYNPTNLGNGTLSALDNEKNTAVVPVVITPAARTLTLSGDTLVAGSTTPIAATVTDSKGRKRTDLAQLIRWELINNPEPGDRLSATSGATVGLTATKAYRTITVRGSFTDPETGQLYSATIAIVVVPGPPERVVVESDSSPDLYLPDDLTELTMFLNQDVTAPMYAFLRDRYSNLILASGGKATGAQWALDDPADASFAAVAIINGQKWRARVSRVGGGNGETYVIVTQDSLLADTVHVTLSDVKIVRIRVVDATADTVVTSISMTTDDQMILRVEGLPSNCDTTVSSNCWIAAQGIFTLTGAVAESGPSDASVGSWTFRPKTPGTGTLTVADTNTVRIPVNITAAAPSKITFELIDKTPTAGQRFRAVVKIENQDGPVPGTWCYSGQAGRGLVAFFDTLGRGVTRPYPTAFTDNSSGGGDLDTGALGVFSLARDSVQECFVNGIDTVDFVLYNAAPGNQHRLYIRLQGKTSVLQASTEGFPLSPGPVDSVVIMSGGKPAPDSLWLAAPTDFLYAVVQGYDEFGNLIGPVDGNWKGAGDLSDITAGPSTNIYVNTTDVKYDEFGCITVTAQDNPSAQDVVCLTIISPPAHVTRALTRDTSGNGYLDRIEVHFSKEITISASAPLDSVVVVYTTRSGNTKLTVADIVGRDGDLTDSVFFFELAETQNNTPQTDWLPTITLKGIGGVTSPAVPCSDGAGPVVWRVVKQVVDVNDRTKDVVTVTFSEDLDRTPGTADAPADVFLVWTRNPDGTFSAADTLLSGIDFFRVSLVANTASFLMTNGKDLTQSKYLSINMTDPAHPPVGDAKASNPPVANNLPRQVEVIGAAFSVRAGPNPFAPTARVPSERTLTYRSSDVVLKQAFENGGTAIVMEIALPSDSNAVLEGQFMVYDLVGNLVHRRADDGRLIPDSWRANWPDGTQRFGIYWNGLNDKGMKCLPGIYRGLIKLTLRYDEAGKQVTERFSKVIAIGVKR